MTMMGPQGMGPQGSSGASRGWQRRRPIAEINVTPFIDVMLVLLIIFMVTAPLLVAGVPVDLPNAKAKSLPQDNVPIQLSIDKAGIVYLDKLVVARTDLPGKLAALKQARDADARVYVRADASLPYGQVISIVGEATHAGFKKVALVTNVETSK